MQPMVCESCPRTIPINYVSLLPGENRDIEIEYPSKSASGPAQLTLRGWNLAKQVVSIP
jgi:hypothetical protein